jgi:hypothetical protein
VSGDRVQAAREEIRRRRVLAQAATPGRWTTQRGNIVANGCRVAAADDWSGLLDRLPAPERNAAFIAANDPAHALTVLDAAEKVLERHAPMADGFGFCEECEFEYPCPDALAVLNLYAPGAT